MVVTRVETILEGMVRLKKLTAKLRDLLIENGFEVVPDGYGYPAVKFNETSENQAEGDSLAAVLIFLAKNGVAFSIDPKQIYSPAYAIELFREEGLYQGKFTTCVYDGHNWIFNER